MKYFKFLAIIIATAFLPACYSPKILTNSDFSNSSTPADSIIANMPNYQNFKTVKGRGKAIVSEPDNSSHISIKFAANRNKSLITIQNSLGIKGGKILSTPDSLVIYNRIDNFIRIVPVGESRYSRINDLASVNLVDILTVPVSLKKVDKIQENKNLYLLTLPNNAKVFINKDDFTIQQVDQSEITQALYSRVRYEGYKKINGFSIPRRITIFSTDGSSKVSLLIQSLQINTAIGELEIEIPEDIPVYRK
ncbi:MAG TPA: DUF4292 domain-containing protein [Balneolaceae bacterium]|nr:DUF4292 domain-containing protein [Balneolaceae bacterium]